MKRDIASPPPAAGTPRAPALGAACVLAALAFAALLALRPVASYDTGYHLAYGEHFMKTLRPVDSDRFIYIHDPGTPPAQRPQLAPGCWYDPDGHVRFPNANWLSQVLMAQIYALAGMNGLSVLTAVLVVACLALAGWTMRRLGVPSLPIAAGILLICLAGYERFNLRPELPGYLVLLLQLAILAPTALPGRALSRREGVALVALQLLFVNLHSYFVLGMALTGAFLADAVLRRADPAAGAEAAARLRFLLVLLVCQSAACFINPWTWRLAILPVQTLLYLWTFDIAGGIGGQHPWANIAELHRTFTPAAFQAPVATWSFIAAGLLTAVSLVVAARQRRWGWVLVALGMLAVSLSARRNMTVALLIAVPLAVASLAPAAASALARPRVRAALTAAFLLLVAALAAAVATQRFYRWDHAVYRFGAGADEVWLPLAPADWISRHNPAGRLWTDVNASSNMHFFTRPRRDVPSLTNTWAYPPSVFQESLELVAGRRKPSAAVADPYQAVSDAFEPVRKTFGVEMVALFVAPQLAASQAPSLGNSLARDPAWALVCLDTQYLLFLRTDGPNRQLAFSNALRPSPLSPAGAPLPDWFNPYLKRVRAADPIPANSLWLAGRSCQYLGWHNEAIELLTASLAEDPRQPLAWNALGISHALRADARKLTDSLAALRDYAAAGGAFNKASALGSAEARENLRRLPVQ